MLPQAHQVLYCNIKRHINFNIMGFILSWDTVLNNYTMNVHLFIFYLKSFLRKRSIRLDIINSLLPRH